MLIAGRGRDSKPLCDEFCPYFQGVATGLSHYRLGADGHCAGAAAYPVAVEKDGRRRGKTKERRYCRGDKNKGSAFYAGGLFCLLRGGSHGNAMGKHLFCAGKAPVGRSCGAACLVVLHRNDGGQICRRLFYRQAGRQAHDYAGHLRYGGGNNSYADTHAVLRAVGGGVFDNGFGVRARLPRHSAQRAAKLRQRKLRSGDGNTAGKRLRRHHLGAAAVRRDGGKTGL